MTTLQNDAVVVEPSGLVRVCAWCVAKPRLVALHRAYRCSDGMCERCSARLEQEAAPTHRHPSLVLVAVLVLGMLLGLCAVQASAQGLDCVTVTATKVITTPWCAERMIVTAAPVASTSKFPLGLAGFAAIATGDVMSSQRAFKLGAQEGGLGRGLEQKPLAFIALKSGLIGSELYILHRLHQTHPKAAWALAAVFSSVEAFAVSHNLGVVRGAQ